MAEIKDQYAAAIYRSGAVKLLKLVLPAQVKIEFFEARKAGQGGSATEKIPTPLSLATSVEISKLSIPGLQYRVHSSPLRMSFDLFQVKSPTASCSWSRRV